MTELDMVLDDLLKSVGNDYLEHYGKGHDDNPPGRGSGRYAFGSGKNPKQHVDEGQETKKKKGLFSTLQVKKSERNKLEEEYEFADLRTPEYKAKKLVQAIKRNIDPNRPYKTKSLSETSEVKELAENEAIRSARKAYEDADSEYPKYAKDDKSIEYYARMAANVRYKLDDYETNYPSQSLEGMENWYVYDDGDQGDFNSFQCYLIDHNVDLKSYAEKTFDAHKNYNDLLLAKVKEALGVFADQKLSANDWRTYGDIVSDAVKERQDSQSMFYFGWYDSDYSDEVYKRMDEAKQVIAEYKKTHQLKHSDDFFEDFLQHYGVGPDDDPPGRGSGRYRKGSGKNPYQHDPAMRKKKMGLFARVGSRIKKFKEDREEAKRIQKEWDEEQFRLAEEERKKRKRLEALEKARETKAANKAKAEEERKTQEAHDEEKRKAIASGDPEQISKFLSELSNQEQFDAINRIRQTQSINDAAKAQAKAREDARRAEEERIAAEKKAEEDRRKAIEEANRPKTKEELKAEKAAKRKEKFDNFMNKSKEILDQGSRVRELAEKGIDIWNTIATINNAFNDDHQMTLIKRPDQIWKEKAAERQEQLKWEREQEKKNAENQENKNQNSSNQNSNSKPKTDSKPESTVEPTKEKTESKSKPEKEKPYSKPETVDGEFREVKPEHSITSYDFSDAVKRLSASSEEVSKAAEAGQKFWMTVVNGGGSYFGSSSESNANYNRDRSAENSRYNEWEKEQQKTSAAQAKFIDQILSERKGERDNQTNLILGNINYNQYKKKDRKFIKDNKGYHEEAEKNGVDVSRDNDYLHRTISAGNKENIQREKESAINRLAERLSDWRDYRDNHPGSRRAEIGISNVYDDAKKLGLNLDEILEKAKK